MDPYQFAVTDLSPVLSVKEPVTDMDAGTDRDLGGLTILVVDHDLTNDRPVRCVAPTGAMQEL